MAAARGFGARLALIAAGALAVRVAYVVFAQPEAPFISDPSTYHQLGANLADGHGYIRPYDLHFAGHMQPTAEFPPAFPFVVAGLELLGVHAASTQQLLVCVLGVATVVLVGLLGRAVHSESAGLVAAGLAAINPLLFGGDGALMAEVLYTPLVIGAVLVAFTIARGRTGWWRWPLLGVLGGLAALTRGEGVIVAVLLLITAAAAALRRRPASRVLSGAVIGLLLAAGVLAPWVARNVRTFDRVVLLSNNGSALLAGANCRPAYHGASIGGWVFSCLEAAHVAGRDEAVDADVSRREAIEFARDHSSRLPAVAGVRVLRTLGVWNPPAQAREAVFEGRVREFELGGIVLGWLLLPLACVGAFVLRSQRVFVWALAVPVVATILVTLGGYGSVRFRHSAEPIIAVLAAVTLVELVRRWRATV